jgi:uncharacterized membrane protein
MTMPSFPTLLIVMAAAAITCRFAGFLIVGLLPRSPRLDAALRATPLSVMAGITAVALMNGSGADAIALSGTIALTFLIGNDLIAALCGVALVAALRWAGV